MFVESTVSTCPVVKQCRGRMEIDPEILGWFAGAAEDHLEWLAILLGTASKDGFEVTVRQLFVPRVQERSYSSCDVDDKDIPDKIRPHIVGVVHSHNSMGAFFSSTDKALDGVNSRFPSSIVISSKMKDAYEYSMGFGMEAEGRVILECGSMAVVKFGVIPLGMPDWPYKVDVVRAHDLTFKESAVDSLGDCDNYKPGPGSNRYQLQKEGKCSFGLKEKSLITRPYIFGKDGGPILKELPKPKPVSKWRPSVGLVPIGSGGRNDERPRWWEEDRDYRGISRDNREYDREYNYARGEYGHIPREELTRVDDDKDIDEYTNAYLKGWGHVED